MSQPECCKCRDEFLKLKCSVCCILGNSNIYFVLIASERFPYILSFLPCLQGVGFLWIVTEKMFTDESWTFVCWWSLEIWNETLSPIELKQHCKVLPRLGLINLADKSISLKISMDLEIWSLSVFYPFPVLIYALGVAISLNLTGMWLAQIKGQHISVWTSFWFYF